ncbi:MAG: tRNA glutamyl-Q(34) synthetase GluQRS [Bacteroidales bacterium]|nr:tRNA glutamyl-Q(34) synthetase GluQRS [Bacteroidales bacterium]
MSTDRQKVIKGRFAPSPSGRMHLGNVFTAVLSWLSVKSRGGEWLLRIEDLDPARSKRSFSELIEDDLHWLGLDWDEGGLEGKGECGPYCQSERSELYERALDRLTAQGLTYPCYCTRGELMATNAPHLSDGRVVYAGTCRPERLDKGCVEGKNVRATRLRVAEEEIRFCDGIFGETVVDLSSEVGDFVVRRGDGAWAYQLAVVVDDAMMGVTEVMRGCDLLQSAAQQIYLYRLLGYEAPRFVHVPLLCNEAGQRLSKRDGSLNMEALRKDMTAEEILGRIGFLAGLTECGKKVKLTDLLELYNENRLPKKEQIIV